jgi:tRNA(adenine34) deaminase
MPGTDAARRVTIGTNKLPSDETFMKLALDEAIRAVGEGEVPVGAVLVDEGEVMARAHNMPISLHDPTAHAEILVLREAALRKLNYRLPNSVLYVTVEPCLMCAGALLQARVARLVFGTADPKAGACGSVYAMLPRSGKRPGIAVVSGVLERECREIIQDFFKRRRHGEKQ